VWSEAHFAALEPITAFIASQGAVPGIQLAHAGRKGSTYRPWSGSGAVSAADGAWTAVGPSAERFTDGYPLPEALDTAGIAAIRAAFVTAATRAVAAGFRVIEIHAAHGYLLHEFLSPLSNHRTDSYGGSFDNRTRFLRDTVSAVRAAIPDSAVLFVRISATDWTEGGWTAEDSVALARVLKPLGVDVVDCSSGGNVATAKIPVGAGYQTPFAAQVRKDAGIATAAVGMITNAVQADQIVRNGEADMVLLARELLRDPYWPVHAAEALHQVASWPTQYLRAAPRGSVERKPL
jgi:2,4-dienoyl-CoA reductase-like NADH-dependent reductase (Old Yellow Enzyme family)